MEAILSGKACAQRTDTVPAHTKLLTAFVIIFAVVLSKAAFAFLGYFILALVLWKRSPMGLRVGLQRLMVIDVLVILTILPLPFTFVTAETIHWGPLSLSEAGLIKASEVFIKATLSAIIMISQFSGISELELSKSLYILKVPTRFILLLQFSIRYISVMQQELSRLSVAMRARGFGSGPTMHNWKSYGYLFGMLLVRALARADRIWFAMKCRGYKGYFPATSGTRKHPLINREASAYLIVTAILFAADLTGILPGFLISMD